VSKSGHYKKQRRLLISKNTIAYFYAFFQTKLKLYPIIYNVFALQKGILEFNSSALVWLSVALFVFEVSAYFGALRGLCSIFGLQLASGGSEFN